MEENMKAANSEMKEMLKKRKTILKMIYVVVKIAASMPADEKYKLTPALRKPAHEILNNTLDPKRKYAESTVRRYYSINKRSCAELIAYIDIAFFNGHIDKETKTYVVKLVNKIERETDD
jgi:four helix bundle protein